ncbi:glycosyltransferase family 4 protein [Ferruginibacter lapsinanis]|uniref:glycosyltransferase family 4 protein n=1 Tax=Ferruginibacter lapsinanis TaxID=563172 RepID=UPI001E64055A|nr:glycosyltransferase family 4 protein [Ferruginibacter lapsinanis]UEG50548.1 glycosyltransferase family 4 protein [Ferruginibacter lapsinanis]
MKNIAIVSNTSWYVYNFRKGFLSELIRQGYNVFVIAPKDKFVVEIELLGCSFIELKQIQNKGKNPFQEMLLTLELRKYFKSRKIDVALFYTPKINIFGSIATKFSSTKGVATINGLGFVFNEGQPKWLQTVVKNLYRFAFSGLPAVFFQNEEDKEFFIKSKILCGKKQCICVVRGSGVNLDEFYQKKNNPGSPSALTFLLSARLIREKGINEYLEAAKIVKQKYANANFALLGVVADNPSAIPVEVITQLYKEGVIDYWGSSDNMSETFNKVDIMVLPSYYREGIPKVLIEALSKGLPVITTDNVGCRETVEDGKNGYLIPVKNIHALSEAMEKMILLTPEQRNEMGEYSRRKAVNEFDEKSNHLKYVDLIKALP